MRNKNVLIQMDVIEREQINMGYESTDKFYRISKNGKQTLILDLDELPFVIEFLQKQVELSQRKEANNEK